MDQDLESLTNEQLIAEVRILRAGIRSEVDEDAAHTLLEKRVAELGPLSYEHTLRAALDRILTARIPLPS